MGYDKWKTQASPTVEEEEEREREEEIFDEYREADFKRKERLENE